jgi:thiol-disulfide isomerase/thioredoxin/outer membrane lipoprotein-sorting protein
MPMTRLLLFLAAASALAQTPPAALVSGSWINENGEHPGITQLVVRQDQGRILVHAWGSCTPLDCDWGEAAGDIWNGSLSVNFDHGFAMERLQLVPLPGERLIAVTSVEYRDGSGRTNNSTAEFYTREKAAAEGAEALKARALLTQVADAYRNLPAARLEFTQVRTRSGEKTEIRSEVQTTLLFSPPNRWRRESAPGGELRVEIADGHTDWTVFPKANEYQKTPEGAATRPFEFHRIDQVRGTPEILRQEKLADVDCTVVHVPMGRTTTEDVWVDDATHLVRRSVMQSPNSREEVTYTSIQLGVTIPPEALAYDPEAVHAVNGRSSMQHPETMIGEMAPDVTLRDLDGHEVNLRDLRGKVVLLDFWATWCGPCRESMPVIELLHRSAPADKLAVFGVDDEAPEVTSGFLKKFGYTVPSLVDGVHAATRAFLINAYPTTVLIDRDGRVTFYKPGAEAEAIRDALRAAGVW